MMAYEPRSFSHAGISKEAKRAIMDKIRSGVPPEDARDQVAEEMMAGGRNLDGTPIQKPKHSGQKPPPYKGGGGKYSGPKPPPYKGNGGGYSGPKPPPYKGSGGGYSGPKPPPYKGKSFSVININPMNELKAQLKNTRAYLYQNKMFSELEGFDAAIRMFADANKKTFKQKAAEVWKKHKGKILAGAGALALAGAGYGAYKGGLFDKYKSAVQKQQAKIDALSADKDAAIRHGDEVRARDLARQIEKEQKVLKDMIAAEAAAKEQREAMETGARKEAEYKKGISDWASEKWQGLKDYTSDWWDGHQKASKELEEDIKRTGGDLYDMYKGRKAKDEYYGTNQGK